MVPQIGSALGGQVQQADPLRIGEVEELDGACAQIELGGKEPRELVGVSRFSRRLCSPVDDGPFYAEFADIGG